MVFFCFCNQRAKNSPESVPIPGYLISAAAESIVADQFGRSPVKARTYSIAIYAVNAHAEGLLGGAV